MKLQRIIPVGILLMLISAHAFSQNVTFLYYDENGKGLDTKKHAAFYRNAVLDDNKKTADTVNDFYMNGNPMAKGRLSVVDKHNNNNGYWIGKVSKFNEDGKLVQLLNYDENGLLNGIQQNINPEGYKTEEFEYLHGNLVRDYYLRYDKKGATTKCSYLTHLPMSLASSDKTIVPFTLKKITYNDGVPVQYYLIDGLSVAVKVSTKQLYGDYYEAYVTIENGSGEQFNFDPTDITASLEKDGKVQEGDVLSYDQYIKKVNRRQAWTAAFTAFAQAAAATTAGYSSSTTNAYARSSSGKSVSVQSTTTSYNGAATYAAAQNAVSNVNQLTNQQYDIKQTISEGYLKLNTIFPNSRLVGFVNIRREPADHIYLNVPVNGKVYHFEL